MNVKKTPREIMQEIQWFSDLKPEHFEKMVQIASLHNLPADSEIFREGDRQDKLYIVVEGRVALEIFIPHQGRLRILTAEAMDVIGWSAATPGMRTRTASAKTVIPSTLIGIDSEAMRQLSKEDHEFGYLVMRRMANIIASRLMVTRLQLLDMFAVPSEEGDA
jgi:CRP/FNR family transcriptional regulator, cyclic AMP receptor protein